ncbi:MAG: hypothetical protein Q7T19_01910 [Caulobacter sp.]|nr:hypothetical protein [Caulobacter sp.]
MPKSVIKQAVREGDDFLDDALHALKKAARHVGEDSQDAMGKAVTDLTKATEKLVEEARAKAVPAVKDAAKDVAKAAKDHPVAATALVAAAVALVGLAISRRGGGDA